VKTVAETIRKLKEFRKGITLGGISVRELIDAGRRETLRGSPEMRITEAAP